MGNRSTSPIRAPFTNPPDQADCCVVPVVVWKAPPAPFHRRERVGVLHEEFPALLSYMTFQLTKPVMTVSCITVDGTETSSLAKVVASVVDALTVQRKPVSPR